MSRSFTKAKLWLQNRWSHTNYCYSISTPTVILQSEKIFLFFCGSLDFYQINLFYNSSFWQIPKFYELICSAHFLVVYINNTLLIHFSLDMLESDIVRQLVLSSKAKLLLSNFMRLKWNQNKSSRWTFSLVVLSTFARKTHLTNSLIKQSQQSN